MTKQAIISGVGHYVPERIVTNYDLEKLMDTSHEWIVERTGIEQRRYVDRAKETTSTMGTEAARKAIADAGLEVTDIDFIIFATLSPDYYFPGGGVITQRQLGLSEQAVGALDVRNQCSGFIYALSVAQAYIRAEMYQHILVIGAETHSMGLDFSTRGRDISVLFGDGAGAVVVSASDDHDKGILDVMLHADGRQAEQLSFICPGSHGGIHDEEDYGFADDPHASIFVTPHMLEHHQLYPYMNGREVFKYAVKKFPEVIGEVLASQKLTPDQIDLLVPHQANLRISQYVQRTLGLRDDQVYNNIQRYGNTTSASIPIAMSEARAEGRLNRGDLLCLAAFGSGFTWGAALVRY